MRILVFKILLVFLSIILLFSCKENDLSVILLTKAQIALEDDPDRALRLLDSIHNPEEMDKEKYMQYLVTRIRARYKTQLEIANDTLIFEAQKYFRQENDPINAAYSNFYSGNVYFLREMPGKAMGYFMQSRLLAEKNDDYVLSARSSNNIGLIYFNQNVMDSALVYYRKVLHSLSRDKDTRELKLNAFNTIGRIYEDTDGPYETGDIDSAYYYFDKGFIEAKRIGNKKFERIFTHNLGLVFRHIEEYDKAIDYLLRASADTPNFDDSTKVYLNLVLAYTSNNQPDSAKQYAILLKDRLPKTTDKRIYRSMTYALSQYYEKIDSLSEALRYANLSANTYKKIIKVDKSPKIFEADKIFILEQKQKELDNKDIPIVFYIVLAFSILVAMLLILKDIKRTHKSRKEDNLLYDKIEYHKSDYSNLLEDVYQTIKDELPDEDATNFESKNERKPLFDRVQGLVSFSKLKSNIKLTQWAKSNLKKQSFDKNIISKLKDSELILLALCYENSSSNEISLLLEIEIENVDIRKKELESTLKKNGVSDTLINQIFTPS